MSKKYDEAKAKIEAGKAYTPLAAVSLVKEIHPANFDETVEVHFRLVSIPVRLTSSSVAPLASLMALVRRFALQYLLKAMLLVLQKKLAQTS